jgi:helicase SWR1
MDGLAEDADLPIEELMRKYGYGGGDEPVANGDAENPPAPVETDTGASPLVDVDDEEPQVNGRLSASPLPSGHHADEEVAGSDDSSPAAESGAEEEVGSEREGSPVQDRVNLRPPFLLRGSLRPYQQAGLEWLASLYASGVNGYASSCEFARRLLLIVLGLQNPRRRDGTRVRLNR